MESATEHNRYLILTGRRTADAYLTLSELPGRLITLAFGSERSGSIRTQVLTLKQAIELRDALADLIAHALTQPEVKEPETPWSGAERRDAPDD